MKTMFKKEALATRTLTIIGVLSALMFVMSAGCISGFNDENVPEGDRCDPLTSHNECSSGLVCTGQGPSPAIPYCPENYCCSVDSNGNLNSTNPNCQPGCYGGAAAICNATKDPNACAVAAGMPLPSADGGTE